MGNKGRTDHKKFMGLMRPFTHYLYSPLWRTDDVSTLKAMKVTTDAVRAGGR